MLSLEFFVCSTNDHLDVWVNLSIDDIMATQNFETPVSTDGQILFTYVLELVMMV